MNYRFQKLLGAPCRGGNAVITKNTELISPVGNRVSVTDLNQHRTVTLLLSPSSNICRLAASPDESEDDHSEPPSHDTPKWADEEYMDRGRWVLLRKDGFDQASAKVSACNYHQGIDMVVLGFSDGVFGLYQMPDFICTHLLSIWREKLTTTVFNERGTWLTNSVQLLVSQWQSKSQRGHYFDVNCVTYSPYFKFLAHGADDSNVKMWDVMVAKSRAGKCTTRLCYSADGGYILAAGTRRYICMSDILHQMVSFLTYLLRSCCVKYTIILLLLPRTSSAEEQCQGEYTVPYIWILFALVVGAFFPVVVWFLWRSLQKENIDLENKGNIRNLPKKKKKNRKKKENIDLETTLPDSSSTPNNDSEEISEDCVEYFSEDDPSQESHELETFQQTTVKDVGWKTMDEVSVSDTIIGESGDVKMALGLFGKRPIIAKYGPNSYAMANEKKILIASDFHPNIVRYISSAIWGDQVLHCLELWQFTFGDLIDNVSRGNSVSQDSETRVVGKNDLWTATGVPKRLLISLIRDIVLGLDHLHGLDIVHRDLTPQTVMIMSNGNTITAKTDDMRMAWFEKEQRFIHFGDEKFSGFKPLDETNYGTESNKVDMFSLGVLMFYIITQGEHPFSCGGSATIEQNIRNNHKNLDAISNFPEAADLIPHLLNLNPVKRPSASDVLRHPFFWNSQQKLKMITEVSDHLYGNFRLQNILENRFARVMGVGVRSWDTKLDSDFFTDINAKVKVKANRQNSTTTTIPKYNYSTLCDLLRLIRNTESHFREIPQNVQQVFPNGKDTVFNYFDHLFPSLFVEVYRVAKRQCSKEKEFKRLLLDLPPFDEVKLL
ncbi:PREDICTED: serine/threonine-protein kinase/endoribonuclease IRE1a-like [Camelina sativa]|uniref:non-specific serine/threonine protein kinase n=1 Tax=Camelina sativa TaxID=90675 RepID=A0ABM0YJZ8_CAMSA|nr:PREDICTED: serine/threonine-protein kinase/endoribonuclease IRE1a-like [Camelina sativa]